MSSGIPSGVTPLPTPDPCSPVPAPQPVLSHGTLLVFSLFYTLADTHTPHNESGRLGLCSCGQATGDLKRVIPV